MSAFRLAKWSAALACAASAVVAAQDPPSLQKLMESGQYDAVVERAAEGRSIPWLRLNDQSLVQLGHGKYQQRIQATVSGRTPHIAVELASDKEETNKILASLGLPVPRQELVQPRIARAEALKLVQEGAR